MSIWLDALFGNYEWYQFLKKVTLNVIILAETTGEKGGDKRAKAIDAIFKALEDAGVKLPFPDFLVTWFIGLVIDLLVGFLNTKLGKDWLAKVNTIVKFE